jgi:hypothetical protein
LELKNMDLVWNSVEMSGHDLTTRIEAYGWQCMRLTGGFSRVSLGRTAEAATAKVVKAALDALSTLFNAAEIDSLHIATYRGFSVARVTVHGHHIQRNATSSHWSVRRKELDGDQAFTP